MLNTILDYRLDWAAFGTSAFVLMSLVRRNVLRKHPEAVVGRLPWIILGLVVIGAFVATDAAANAERAKLKHSVSGFAPTYARTLEELGHAEVASDAPVDDVLLRRLSDQQKRWLNANTVVTDIYTMRLGADGVVRLIVDSETDYDRDGVIAGAREAATDPGEVYPDEDVSEEMRSAFAGFACFQESIYEDRWGVWVSAFEPLRAPDGRVEAIVGVDYPAANWLSSIAFVRLGVLGLLSGLIVGIVLVAGHLAPMRAEIARRRRAEESLRRSNLRARAVFMCDPECLAVLDLDGVFCEINSAGIASFGAGSDSELDGRSVLEFLIEEDRATFESLLASAVTGPSVREELRVRRISGHIRRFEVLVAPLAVEDDGPRRLLFGARDVTERREAEQEAARLHAELLVACRKAGMAEVATHVRHNVGNVLNSVGISAEELTSQVRAIGPENLRRAADMIKERRGDLARFLESDEMGRRLPDYLGKFADGLAERRNRLLTELESVRTGLGHIKELVASQQAYAKNGSGVTTQEKPASIAEDALGVIRPALERHRIRSTLEYEDLPPMMLDRHKILQILVNLITNAKDALAERPADGAVQIFVRRTESGVEFAVRDNGRGITQDDQARLFRQGFTTRSDGHGFGLHASSNAACEMGGTLTATSPGPGLGAEFRLTIPLVVAGDPVPCH